MNVSGEHAKMTRACPTWTGPLPQGKSKKGVRRIYMEVKTLNQWRRERGLSIEEVASHLGLSVGGCRNILNYSKPITRYALRDLLELFQIDEKQVLWKPATLPVPAMPRSPDFPPTANTLQVSRKQYEIALQWIKKGRTKREIAEAMGVSRSTLYKALERYSSEDTYAQAKAKATEHQQKASAKPKAQKPTQARSRAAKAGAT